jgi:hypothetical protein
MQSSQKGSVQRGDLNNSIFLNSFLIAANMLLESSGPSSGVAVGTTETNRQNSGSTFVTA